MFQYASKHISDNHQHSKYNIAINDLDTLTMVLNALVILMRAQGPCEFGKNSNCTSDIDDKSVS